MYPFKLDSTYALKSVTTTICITLPGVLKLKIKYCSYQWPSTERYGHKITIQTDPNIFIPSVRKSDSENVVKPSLWIARLMLMSYLEAASLFVGLSLYILALFLNDIYNECIYTRSESFIYSVK